MPTLLEQPALGDRVRVVLEGEVGSLFDNGGFRITGSVNVFRPSENPAVQSVEVLPQLPKVGDVIEGVEAYSNLPAGALLKGSYGYCMADGQGNLRATAGWDLRAGEAYSKRTLVYLPED